MYLKSLVRALSAVIAIGFGATAADATDVTTIKVQGMHCVSCARKVSGQVQAVPEAGRVDVNPTTGLATIMPRTQAAPSPRLLWEAVERAGYKPVEIIGPYGTFQQKPQR